MRVFCKACYLAFDSPFAPMFIFGIFQTDDVVVYRHFNSHETKRTKNKLGWEGEGVSQLSLRALQAHLTPRVKAAFCKTNTICRYIYTTSV